MHARFVTVQLQTAKIEEAIAIYRDAIIPAARQQQGFLGARLFVNRATGKGVSVSRWASEADLLAGEASGYYAEQIAKLAPLFTAPPIREAFEISVEADA